MPDLEGRLKQAYYTAGADLECIHAYSNIATSYNEHIPYSYKTVIKVVCFVHIPCTLRGVTVNKNVIICLITAVLKLH